MPWNINDVLDRISSTEGERAGFRHKAERWERMWRLEPHRESQISAHQDNREQVTLPTPYNVVNLAMRLLAGTPTIDVPEEDVTEDKEGSAADRKQFLLGLWDRSGKDQGTNLTADAAWWGLVRGRFVFEVKWVEEALPPRLRDRRCPIMIRTLDPMNVGVKRGPNYTHYAFHRYESQRQDVLQRFADEKKFKTPEFDPEDEATTCMVCDFWYVNTSDGTIWNCILVDDRFVKEPKETNYPDIPIIESGGDSTPLADETNRYNSILNAIDGSWHYQCTLASQIATGLMWYFWPAILIKSDTGRVPDNINVGPGKTTPLPPGVTAELMQMNVNVPLADAMMSLLQANEQQSTFPGVMYGDAPGQVQAGFGVSILADAAKGRINNLRQGMERAIEYVNEVAMGIVEAFGDEEKGVAVWGFNESSDQLQHVVIYPSQVSGFYENHVSLSPNLPENDLQKQTLGLRFVESGIMSKKTFRQKMMGMNMPANEDKRVILEQAMMDEEMGPLIKDLVLTQYFENPNWKRDLQEFLVQIGGGPEDAAMGMPPMPQGMAPGAMPPQMGPPPSMQPQQPMPNSPLPPQMQGQITPEMLQAGIPPELFQQLINGQVPPPVPTNKEIIPNG